MKKYEITVFTPTYNRAYILRNVYESLLKQKFVYFEWLIVDDGSTDNTEELVKSFLEDKAFFDIVYVKKENGGQHTALNKAIELAQGEYLMIVDSDDYISENALERVSYWIHSLETSNELFCGVSGLKAFSNGSIVGKIWNRKEKYIDINPFHRAKYGLDGDKAEVFKIEVLKKFYPIPVFEDENDVEKGVLWNRVSNAGYKIRYFNEVIYFCEYLEDGMTKNIYKNWLKNFKGYTLWMKELIHSNISEIQQLKNTCMFVLLAQKKGMGIKEISNAINVNVFKVVLAIGIVTVYHKGIAQNKYAI